MMPRQLCRYRRLDGGLSTNRDDAILVSPAEIIAVAHLASSFPPGLFVGIAERETAYALNEMDTDFKPDGSIRGTTYGLFQTSNPADVGNLDSAVATLAYDLDRYWIQIAAAARLAKLEPPPRDAFAYLCWAHNEGIGAAIKSIRTYGLDWGELVRRNRRECEAGAHDPDHGAGYVMVRLVPYVTRVLACIDRYPGGLVG